MNRRWKHGVRRVYADTLKGACEILKLGPLVLAGAIEGLPEEAGAFDPKRCLIVGDNEVCVYRDKWDAADTVMPNVLVLRGSRPRLSVDPILNPPPEWEAPLPNRMTDPEYP